METQLHDDPAKVLVTRASERGLLAPAGWAVSGIPVFIFYFGSNDSLVIAQEPKKVLELLEIADKLPGRCLSRSERRMDPPITLGSQLRCFVSRAYEPSDPMYDPNQVLLKHQSAWSGDLPVVSMDALCTDLRGSNNNQVEPRLPPGSL